MGYKLVTAPSGEPLSLQEAKVHCRVFITDDDTLIGALIVAARQYAEQLTARCFVTQTWQLVLDSFPGVGLAGYAPWGQTFGLPGNAILLEKGPIQSVDSITYVDMAGATQTLASTEYIADLSSQLVRITPKFGKVWPIALPQIASVTVAFTAGYGAASAVPQGLKQWLLLRIAALYENREEFVTGRSIVCTPLPFIDGLLDPYRILRGD